IAEIEKIMKSGGGGIGQNLVTLQPVSRMNAVLAVSRKPEALHRIETWIHRLDIADTGRSSIHVYHLKYGEARQVAQILTSVFGGGSGSSSASQLDSAAGQIAPGSGYSSSSSSSSPSSRLGAGGNSQSSGFGSRSQGGGGFGDSSSGTAASSAAPGAQAGNTPDVRGGGGSLFDAGGAVG